MSSAIQRVRCTRMPGIARARVVASSLVSLVLLFFSGVRPAQSQSTGLDTLDRLIAEALERSPAIEAARQRVSAARARVRPAGARADPNLMAALVAIPIVKPSLTDDNFTMLMVGVQQSFPYPGKRALRTRAATLDADALGSAIDGAQRSVVRAVKEAWFEIAYLDMRWRSRNEAGCCSPMSCASPNRSTVPEPAPSRTSCKHASKPRDSPRR